MSGSQERSAPSQMSQHQHFCEGSVASADKKKSEGEEGEKKNTADDIFYRDDIWTWELSQRCFEDRKASQNGGAATTFRQGVYETKRLGLTSCRISLQC